uniref:Activin types I and II receptor domain-containing protein n=1 Tax=Caenorhabditis japonica TaxID=281687 RepID=A0A8R1DHD1_CAEJA
MSALHFLLLHLFVTLCSSNPVQNSTNLGKPKDRLYNPLVCYFATEGELFGQEHHEGQHHEPCGPDVKYCQKISAHFISTGGQITKITMKGCDTVSLLPYYAGLECKGNGCTERREADEIYNVCCCDTETCNPSSRSPSLLVHLLIACALLFF